MEGIQSPFARLDWIQSTVSAVSWRSTSVSRVIVFKGFEIFLKTFLLGSSFTLNVQILTDPIRKKNDLDRKIF